MPRGLQRRKGEREKGRKGEFNVIRTRSPLLPCSPAPLLPCSPASWVAVHSALKEGTMEDYSLTLGAHLLLWVFPLLLVVFVIVENLLDSRSRANDR
jgi:hypothetical protein